MAFANFKRVPARRPGGYRQPQHAAFVAPTGGWVSAANLAAAPKGTAQRCENFLPTTTGIRMRAGTQKHGTASATGPLESLMAYVGGATRKMFGAADGAIFDLTEPVDAGVVPTAEVTGQTSNYYSVVNFANSGGNWMHAANGTDALLLYDGTNFYPVTGTDLFALAYDAETAAFTVGSTLTGGTSGATATIVKVIDDGATGTLWINNVASGTFQNDEAITDAAGGSALANGPATQLVAALTGVTTSAIAQVNVYRNRVWLVEKGTMNAHYLATDAVSGAIAGTVALSGVFRNGGSLLFTATWSLDAGDGLDDKIVFVSTEGEVAVYQGDPIESGWGLVGLYDCSPPLGRNAFAKVAGDLLLVTKIGLVPLSQVINKDPGALALAAVSRNIQPDWQAEVASRKALPWEIVKWTTKNIAFISCPVVADGLDEICFAVNLETGAWSKITGWNTRCMVLHDDWVYFGTNSGKLMKTETTGADDGMPIYYLYVGQSEHLAGVGRYTTVMQARAVFLTTTTFNPQIDVANDYEVTIGPYPTAASPDVEGVWDSGLWDDMLWDAAGQNYTVRYGWVSIGKSGFAHAPVLQIASGALVAPGAELVMFEVTHQPGAVVV